MIDLKKMRAGVVFHQFYFPHSVDLTPDQVIGLMDMLEAAQKDQARYKFIEQQHSDADSDLAVTRWGETDVIECSYGKTWPDLSGAIDAAMAATKGEEA